MHEWIIGSHVTTEGSVEIWTTAGQVRQAVYDPWACMYPMFTDCTHPLQGLICGRDFIQAWRPASSSASTRAREG